MISNKYPSVKIKNFFEKIESFKGGTNTLINERRLDRKYAVESVNLLQVEDGVWQTRPGTAYYGTAVAGATNLDGACEYIKTDGTRELIVVGGGKVWKATDGGAWSEVTGATFTAGIRTHFLHIEGRLYIANGTDDLAYYNGTNLTKYTALAEPSAPTGARGGGLSTSGYPNYYRVVATNSVGYTGASASLSIPTDIERSSWNEADEIITLTITPVVGATGYDIYWGAFDGEEYYIGKTSTTTFVDDGSAIPNPYIETPDDNTTAAPKFRSMEVSGNRFWATKDPDNEYRVYGSGVGQYFGYFSPFYGGFYIDLEKGGRNKPVSVVHYRDGKGNPMITVLCSSPDGYGTIFQVELTSATIGDTTFIVPAAYKIVGSIGADATDAVVKCGDNVLFLNKKGVYALRNKEQMYNVLATDDLSAPVRDQLESMTGSYVAEATGYYKPPMAFFSVPVGTTNNRTAIFDFERQNWNWAWNIGFKHLLEHTESTSGITRFLAVPTSGNRLIEISDAYTNDLGTAFYQSYISPLIPVSNDYTDLAKVKEAIFELGGLRGSVTLEVIGLMKNKAIQSLGSASYSSTTGTSGMGDELVSDEPLVSDATDAPETFVESTSKKVVSIKKKVYALQFKVYSTSADTRFTLLGIQATGMIIPSKAPSAWKD